MIPLPDFNENAYIIEDKKPMPIHTLVISNEDFKANMALDLSDSVKKLSGNDYIAWGISLHYLRMYNPNLAVGFECDENGRPYFVDGDKGGYLLAYLYDKSSGATTPSIFFPLRNNKKQAALDPDTVVVGNQQQRAVSKVIAQETGIGWSLYSRIDESMLELEESDKAVTSVSKPSAAKVLSKSTNKTQHDDMDF